MLRDIPMTQDEQGQVTTLQDVRSALERFEVETGLSEREFIQALASKTPPPQVTEEEAVEWDFLLQMRTDIENFEAECRNNYLHLIKPSKPGQKTGEEKSEAALAA